MDEHDLLAEPGACDCDGGWRWVKRPYAEHLAATTDGSEPAAHVIAALLNTVYPCRNCRPDAFYRWANQHWSPDHDVAACQDCADAHGGRRRARAHQAITSRPTAPSSSGPPVGEPPPDYDDGRFPE